MSTSAPGETRKLVPVVVPDSFGLSARSPAVTWIVPDRPSRVVELSIVAVPGSDLAIVPKFVKVPELM